MSLYGDLPPPTHSTPSTDKEETQQSALETQSTSSKTSKSALPVMNPTQNQITHLNNISTRTKYVCRKWVLSVGWTPGTLRFMPTIQRKPVIQAKPKLIPKASVTSPNPPTVSTSSSSQNNAPTSNLNSVISTPPPTTTVSTDSEPIATPSSTSISSPKQFLGSDDVNDYKTHVNNQRNQRSAFEK
ncbi:28576_t:CDS:2, partial [Racocetra persica]